MHATTAGEAPPTMRTTLEAPGAAGGCALRVVCLRSRRSGSCGSCRRSDGAAGQEEPCRGGPRPAAGPDAFDGSGEVAPARWRVHHDLPTRTRFRPVVPVRGASAGAVEARVEAVEGVRSARFSAETGSLLVVHDGTDETRRALRRVLEAMDGRELTPRARAAPEGGAPSREVHGGVVRDAVLSLLAAALPPGPRAVLTVVRSISTLRAASGRARTAEGAVAGHAPPTRPAAASRGR